MKTILVPVDFSETSVNAVEQAYQIATKSSGTIKLVHVFKEGATLPSFFSSSKKSPMLTEEEVTDKMNTLINQYNDGNVQLSYEVKKGKNVSREITEYAEELECDLICMGTHGVSGFQEFWMGSNAYKVISIASVPVLTLRKSFKPKPFSKIVLPLDTTKSTREKVPQTVYLASMFNSAIHILGLPPSEEGELYKRVYNYVYQVADYIEERGFNCYKELLVGSNPTKVTLEYSNKVGADLVSIMTEQETDPANIIIGPYAQQMVNHSEIPVLTSRRNEKLIGNIPTGY